MQDGRSSLITDPLQATKQGGVEITDASSPGVFEGDCHKASAVSSFGFAPIRQNPVKAALTRGAGALAIALVCLCCVAPASGQASGQAAGQQKPLMAEDIFKNVQVLRGIPVDQFLGTMGFISAALSMNCSECHHTGSVLQYADDTPMKQMARRMIVMMNAFNKANFGGKRMITCYTCHRGSSDIPKVTPSLAEQYGTPPPDDPDEVVIPETPAPAPSADVILNKYIQALGGAQKLAAFTSFSQGNV